MGARKFWEGCAMGPRKLFLNALKGCAMGPRNLFLNALKGCAMGPRKLFLNALKGCAMGREPFIKRAKVLGRVRGRVRERFVTLARMGAPTFSGQPTFCRKSSLKLCDGCVVG
jgi:hypothetical protein